MYYHPWGKRCLDLIVAIPALFLALPVLLLLAGVVRVKLGRPVFFRQERPGLWGRSFKVFKFRTMTDARDAAGNLLPDGNRLTLFGRWLRSTSLDELPELLNVLRGEMSLVGPRPLLMRYLPRYSPEQARRHEVKPGLTGWAQVNGRNAVNWNHKFVLDVWYVDHLSCQLDFRILWMTLWAIIRRRGINLPGHSTMPEFMGDPPPVLDPGVICSLDTIVHPTDNEIHP
jgi:sugar transferase EpsL